MVEVVWLNEYRLFAFLKIRNFTHSLVSYQTPGGWTEEWVENDEYELWEERSIEHESE